MHVRRLVLLVATTMAFVQFADFIWALRRYTVGLGSVLNPFARVRGGWDPPVSSVALVVVALIATAAYWWWVRELARLPVADQATAGMPATAGGGIIVPIK